MNKRNKVVAVITSILLAASMASLSIPAQAEQNTDVAPMSCPEIGHHQSVSNKGRGSARRFAHLGSCPSMGR